MTEQVSQALVKVFANDSIQCPGEQCLGDIFLNCSTGKLGKTIINFYQIVNFLSNLLAKTGVSISKRESGRKYFKTGVSRSKRESWNICKCKIKLF